MKQDTVRTHNVVLIRGAMCALLVALLLAWTMVFDKYIPVAFVADAVRDFKALLRAHIDFLLMTALLLGFYGAKVPLPWHVRWAMVIGAFTNSSTFLIGAFFPYLQSPWVGIYATCSFVITSYGFGKGAVIVLRSTWANSAAE